MCPPPPAAAAGQGPGALVPDLGSRFGLPSQGVGQMPMPWGGGHTFFKSC
jgi:hypothetical protein